MTRSLHQGAVRPSLFIHLIAEGQFVDFFFLSDFKATFNTWRDKKRGKGNLTSGGGPGVERLPEGKDVRKGQECRGVGACEPALQGETVAWWGWLWAHRQRARRLATKPPRFLLFLSPLLLHDLRVAPPAHHRVPRLLVLDGELALGYRGPGNHSFWFVAF